MSISAAREYLQRQKVRYGKASRKERSHLLDEMVAMTELNRNYVIQLLHGDLARKPRQQQRGRSYGSEVEEALLVVAESLDFICGKRLQPQLLATAQQLARHGELILSPPIEAALAKISAATIDRLLARHAGRVMKRLPRRGPTRSPHAWEAIPMQIIPWNQQEPGHFEADLVHHSGSNTFGDYVYTLQMIDVATGWSERYAILGRSGIVMQDAFRVIRHRLPFLIKEVHTDNGGEFLAEHMLRFWSQLQPDIQLSRNRPWRKNDSRFVEQKNFTLVRAYLGHRRFDTVAQTRALNYLYELMGLYYNLFQPVIRLTEKTLIQHQGPTPGSVTTRVKRHYDTPQTPFQRLAASGDLGETRHTLEAFRELLNPRQLRREIITLIEEINTLPPAAPDHQPDVFQTLSYCRPYLVKGDWNVQLDFHLMQPLPLTLSPHASG
jgi:transposase InsO family protein